METDAKNRCFFPASRLAQMAEKRHVHQYNQNAVRLTRTLGDLAGLTDMGLHMVRIEPGHETTEHHFHGQDEEFVFIQAGKGIACLGEESFEVGPGDMLMFPKGGPAHSMRNEGPDDLVYLMGGTRPSIDVCTYPRLARWQYRVDGKKEYAALEDFTEV
ncbi:MAG: cupin domain-containing protein [Rhodobiaceae bacterium]|nr:cupin domain-containing protein [Rhodobiaceae bacterium]